MQAQFKSDTYDLIDGDRIVRKAGKAPPASADEHNDESDAIIRELSRYVQSILLLDFDFEAIPLSERDGLEATSTFLATKDWLTSTKIMIIAHNAAGSKMGIFSRSICMDKGLSKGSMIPYIQRAREAGYAVVILRPNTNSYSKRSAKGIIKIPIENSQTPEIHAAHVFEIVEERCVNCNNIALLAYGNGACLCKDIFIRDSLYHGKVKAFLTIEASYIVESDDALDIKQSIRRVAVNFECNSAPRGFRLQYRGDKLGCTALSVGMPTDEQSALLPDGTVDVANRGASLALALEPAFVYLEMANSQSGDSASDQSDPTGKRAPTLGAQFADRFAQLSDIGSAVDAVIRHDPAASGMPGATPDPDAKATTNAKSSGGIFSMIFGKGSSASDRRKSGKNKTELDVDDFELLKVVGKGAFGKVMMVRRKDGARMGEVYAMKVLKKSVVAAKAQVEHTQAERKIMSEVKHPFLVQLRYAFQSEEKLYIVTDYYNGGSLYYHLRRAKFFAPERTRFYAAQLAMALAHLHNLKIIYRDLKLENILMHSSGNIAITDFGLSKQGVDENANTQTFCGTAEYIAPELLEDKPYGPIVDWWSFGILIFEMLTGKTPFVNHNRRLMFYRIQNSDPNFPNEIDAVTVAFIKKLLKKNKSERLGSVETGGAGAVMSDAYFESVDFKALFEKQVPPPFVPELKNDFDLRYIPRTVKEQTTGESFSEEKKGIRPGTKTNINFENFAYNEDK